MNLSAMNVENFTGVLASSSPAPGGGSAAALSGAVGSALAAMVCALTENSAKYAPHHSEISPLRQQADALRLCFLDVMERDTAAFLQVSAAYALPKATDEEKAARSAAIQAGLAACTETPLEMMALAEQALRLTATLSEHFNENAASDLGVAALSLDTAIRGAWLNVRINLSSLKDKALAETYRCRGENLLDSALPLAGELYEKVLSLV